MKDVSVLREQLCEVFSEMRSGKLDVKVAAELNNSAGKIINTAKVELEYRAITKSDKKIPFLEY